MIYPMPEWNIHELYFTKKAKKKNGKKILPVLTLVKMSKISFFFFDFLGFLFYYYVVKFEMVVWWMLDAACGRCIRRFHSHS